MKLHKKFVIWFAIPLLLIVGIVTVFVVFSDLRIELKVHFNQPNPMIRQYTTKEWMSMITQSQHQPTAIWEGVRAGYIKGNGSGSGGGALHFLRTPAKVLERQMSDLLEKDPLMFLPALASKDHRVLLTGLYVYGRFRPDNLSNGQSQKIIDAYRALLTNKNTAIRATGIYKLGAYRQLTVSDIQQGLSDEGHDVRFVTGFWVHIMFENTPVYSKDGKIYKGEKARADQLIEMKRKLAPVLLERLNDPSPFTRAAIAGGFCFMLRRHEHTGSGVSQKLPDFFPARIDWKRDSWHKREETKKVWSEWWDKRGEEALEYAHPSQN